MPQARVRAARAYHEEAPPPRHEEAPPPSGPRLRVADSAETVAEERLVRAPEVRRPADPVFRGNVVELRAPGRRTIRVTGHVPPPARRRPATEAIVARPDRVAMWAVFLGLFLVLVAAVTARGETASASPARAPGVVAASPPVAAVPALPGTASVQPPFRVRSAR